MKVVQHVWCGVNGEIRILYTWDISHTSQSIPVYTCVHITLKDLTPKEEELQHLD